MVHIPHKMPPETRQISVFGFDPTAYHDAWMIGRQKYYENDGFAAS
jgi:hypothetical protein